MGRTLLAPPPGGKPEPGARREQPSRSDGSTVAVGFNPRTPRPRERVAEQRLIGSWWLRLQASLRDAGRPVLHRGLKPTATVGASLREALADGAVRGLVRPAHLPPHPVDLPPNPIDWPPNLADGPWNPIVCPPTPTDGPLNPTVWPPNPIDGPWNPTDGPPPPIDRPWNPTDGAWNPIGGPRRRVRPQPVGV